MNRPRHILPVIVVSQFAGTALWFAGNAVIKDLQSTLGFSASAVGSLVSAVQLGFILGTFVFAILALADRLAPRVLFFTCCLLGAGANAGVLFAENLTTVLLLRAATGFFLAGIYPVGMKIAASWYEKGLGAAIGFLVGALVLGTAFPHLLRGLGAALDYQTVLLAVSALACLGGLLMLLLVPEGPFLRARARFAWSNTRDIFRSPNFRAAAFGYFGHMWELYAMWTFVPFLLAAYAKSKHIALNLPLWSFALIAVGSLGCILGGLLSKRIGSARVATVQLATSGCMCLLSPWLFVAPTWLFLTAMLLWGTTIVGDSPQYSALNAQNAPPELVGTALTTVTCIGFALTIPSIELLSLLANQGLSRWMFLALLPGPLLGLLSMRPLLPPHTNQ